jgi:hypothetical protein
MHFLSCSPSISLLLHPQIQVDDIASSTVVGFPSQRRRLPPPSYSATATSSAVVWTSLGPLPRWVPGPTTRWAPRTTQLVQHGT